MSTWSSSLSRSLGMDYRRAGPVRVMDKRCRESGSVFKFGRRAGPSGRQPATKLCWVAEPFEGRVRVNQRVRVDEVGNGHKKGLPTRLVRIAGCLNDSVAEVVIQAPAECGGKYRRKRSVMGQGWWGVDVVEQSQPVPGHGLSACRASACHGQAVPRREFSFQVQKVKRLYQVRGVVGSRGTILTGYD